MAKTKISKVAKDLNVALPTMIEFLNKKNISIDNNPNARVEDDVVEILMKEFKNDKDQKSKSEQFSSERQKERSKQAPKEAPKAIEEIVLPVEPATQPKIVGKIDINNIGKPAAKNTEQNNSAKDNVSEKTLPKKEEAKPVAESKPQKAEVAQKQPEKKVEKKKEAVKKE